MFLNSNFVFVEQFPVHRDSFISFYSAVMIYFHLRNNYKRVQSSNQIQFSPNDPSSDFENVCQYIQWSKDCLPNDFSSLSPTVHFLGGCAAGIVYIDSVARIT